MAKGKGQGTTTQTPGTNTPHAADAMRALFALLLEGLDDCFQSTSDPPGNYVPAYERANLYAVGLGNAHVASLWQCALDVGFMAGRYLAMQAMRTEGEVIGFEKGKVEGLSEGKRLGLSQGASLARNRLQR